MTRLIDDLLDATRISRGKIPVKLERLNLIELLSECLADQRTSIEQHGLVLALELPEVPIHVEGDHTRLCQVFSNLLLNAVKFCGRGNRITVTVTLDAPAREVAVHVADTGMGIAADFMPRIFEPFTQAESELARTKGGLGLGLALAKALLELHGGRIEASSAGLGLGAEFVVTLPLAQVHEQNDDLSAQAQDASPAAPVVSRRVLVIDDNADGAISIGELLSLEGCEVEIAFTAQSGLEAARRFRPHAILCDIGLPGMDGYEFACEARRQPALESTLLIALTGYSSPDDQRRATQAGFDLHMAKPPDLSVLLTLLRDLRGQDKSKASSLDEGTV